MGLGFKYLFSFWNTILFELIEYSSHIEKGQALEIISSINIDYYIQYCKPKEYGNYDLAGCVNLIVNKELTNNLSLIEKIKCKN